MVLPDEPHLRIEEPDPLVGRGPELGRMLAEVEHARNGTARIIQVVGPAGIGKTRLCRTVVGRADGFQRISAAAEASEADLPYGVLDQLLGRRIVDHVKPALTPPARGAVLMRRLSDLQTDGPVLVWVDDLHWADQSSQQALLFALRRLAADEVVVIVSRLGEDADALTSGMSRFLASDGVVTIPLGGLGAEEIGCLPAAAATGLSARALRRLGEHTGGNPLWIHALLREVSADHLADESRPLPAPKPFAAIVADRLAALSPPAQALVEAAAVAGRPYSLGLVAEVAGVSEPYAALEEASAATLVTVTRNEPPQVTVGHNLVAAAVYERLPKSRRVALHVAFAAGAPRERDRLRHEIAASPGNDANLASRVARAAADHASVGAWAAASSMFSTAAELAETQLEREQLVEQAVAAALVGGNVGGAERLVLELSSTGPSSRRGTLLGWLALAHGRYEEAERLLASAAQVAQSPGEHAVLGEASRLLGLTMILNGRPDEAVAHSKRAMQVLSSDALMRGFALGDLVIALGGSSQVEEALRMASVIDERPDDPHLLMVRLGRGIVRVLAGDYHGAVSDLTAVNVASRATGVFDLLCAAWSHLSLAQYLLGDWAAASQNSDQAVLLIEDTVSPWAAAAVHAHASFLASRRGLWVEAAAHAAKSRQVAILRRDVMSVSYSAAAAAVLAHSRGRFDEVLVAVKEFAALNRAEGLEEPGTLELPGIHAEALIRTGRPDEAGKLLARRPREGSAAARPWPAAARARTTALLSVHWGLVDQAAGEFDRARELAREAETPFEEALVDLQQGQLHRRVGRRRPAVQLLERGLETFAHLGAAPFADIARRELGAAEGAPRADPDVPPSRLLTTQELSVARLVSDGLSNREIASALFISAKTVEYHLGNAYRKLGVGSRTQLVRRLAEL